ncbi:MAG: cob(I)yrinic acid a,c-diamide adenosyltransferase [Propionibacteriaceae bacterium]|nr:cob(I)yrinic acid a,c-diamide adenosyltransferase [Propionibacteriaceae bacterium]
MVNLTRIYTRTGDKGITRLTNNEPVPKSDLRLEAYGTVDEANCAIGIALSLDGVGSDIADVLLAIQNDLFDVGADLSTPIDPEVVALRVEPAWIQRLEDWCDQFSADLPNLRSFVLPGPTPLCAHLNLARVIVRRAERTAWKAAEEVEINDSAIRYLNRLSDLLFILGRYANVSVGVEERLWVPAQGKAVEG